jgi:hypothetical protein
MSEPSMATLAAHLERAFPGRALTRGPATDHARQELPRLEVARLAPARPGEPWVYSTLGAWEATREGPLGEEFFLLSPKEDERHVETLSSVAYYHSFYGLEEGSVYRVARGWFFDSSCDRFFFVPPAGELAALEWLEATPRVRFLRCLPITQDEAEHLKAHGRASLDARFAQRPPNFLDPKRRSVV